MRRNGFTLIEMMIVVAIVGILAAVALPSYQDYTKRAKISEAMVLARPLQEEIVEYFQRWGEFPESQEQLGISNMGSYTGRYVKDISISRGVVAMTLDIGDKNYRIWLQAALPDISGANSSVVWLCMPRGEISGLVIVGSYTVDDSEAIPNQYLTHDCRHD